MELTYKVSIDYLKAFLPVGLIEKMRKREAVGLKNLSVFKSLKPRKSSSFYGPFLFMLLVVAVILSFSVVTNSSWVTGKVKQAVNNWAESIGVKIDLGSIKVGFRGITLKEVTIISPENRSFDYFTADEIYIRFNLMRSVFTGGFKTLTFNTLRGQGVEQGDTNLSEDKVNVPVALPEAEVIVADGVLTTKQGVNYSVRFEVGLKDDRVDVICLEAVSFDQSFSGKFHGEGKLILTNNDIAVQGKMEGEDLRLTFFRDGYDIDKLSLDYLWQNQSLIITDGVAVNSRGKMEFFGDVSGGWQLDLKLIYEGEEISEDIPALTRLGFAGKGQLTGQVSGTVFDPILEGEVVIYPGSTIWHRPDVEGTGHINLTRDRIAFSRVDLYQFQGEYQLEGMYQFAVPNRPGYLELDIRGESGSLAEFLAITGIDYQVEGVWQGDLHLFGTLDDLLVTGDIKATEIQTFNRAFEGLTAGFHFQKGIIFIDRASLKQGTGKVEAKGEIPLSGSGLKLTFNAVNWPVSCMPGILGQQEYIGGSIDIVNGVAEGSLVDLIISGQVFSDALRIGKVSIQSIKGQLAYEKGLFKIDDLTARRAPEAVYHLSGVVGPLGSKLKEVPLNLVMDVIDESLSHLLRLMGQTIPAMLIDSNISGKVKLAGTTANPEAEADIRWTDQTWDLPDMKSILTMKDGKVNIVNWQIE
jgi:hypothetical protein